ncbi:MAG: helix-turn-helix domain-containing protein [Leptospirales bacterium]|nr:helix-turn-helix domain-containing protein [Leptospirales bacterium]
MPDLFNALIFFGGGLALLLSLSQLISPAKSVRNILLFLIFASLSAFQIQQTLSLVREGIDFNNEFHLLLMAEYLLGPSLYLFYLSIFDREYVFSWKTLIHFIAAATAFVLVLILNIHRYITGSFSKLLYGFVVNGNFAYYFHLMGIALIAGYLLNILSRLKIIPVIRKKSQIQGRLHGIAIIITVSLSIVILLMIIYMITGSVFFRRMSLALTTCSILCWFIISQIYPELFYSVSKKKKQSQITELSETEKKRIGKELHKLMDEEKIYCDEDLSLKRLAGLLSVQPHILSAYLNRELSTNFNVFVNNYRIDEAVALMKEDSKRSLLSIAFAVGFNSKSVFYDAFAKKTGTSPAKFRKQNL